MRTRKTLVLVAAALAVAASATAADAVASVDDGAIVGTNGPDQLLGGPRPDLIKGTTTSGRELATRMQLLPAGLRMPASEQRT